MPEGYCVKCKAKKEIIDAVEETMKNGRKAIKGKCPTCGTVMFKILGGKATTSAATPTVATIEPGADGTKPADAPNAGNDTKTSDAAKASEATKGSDATKGTPAS